MGKKVLIIGSGGREHALAWRVAKDDAVEKVFVAPGNAGTALEEGIENVAIDGLDFDALIAFAKSQAIDLSIVGPEAPLVEGIVDRFTAEKLACFGPSKGAAQLEGSKAFTKDFLARHQIPTAAYENFTEVEPAIAYIKKQGAPIVVKADGLAAGKGVILAQSEAEAIAAVEDMLSGNGFGEAGHRVVIEEFLVGEEASFICMVDGTTILPLATSQDHKARDAGDRGPNTGGMGAYSPAPVVTPLMHEKIMQQVIIPTAEGMQAEGNRYRGFLYAGIMITTDGTPKVLEYNCRMGDPETQPIMMRLRSSLADLCLAAINGTLEQCEMDWDPRSALGVVMAAGGYPESYTKGDAITGIPGETPSSKTFHAGTSLQNNTIVTNGGRVLCCTAIAETVAQAQAMAYDIVAQIKWQNAFSRPDIGYRAIAREQQNS